MDISTVDITPIFFQLVHSIATMDKSDLVFTTEYQQMMETVNNEDHYLLYINDNEWEEKQTFYFENVSDLFYGMSSYFDQIPQHPFYPVIMQAMSRMEFHIEMDDVSSIFTGMKV